MNRFELQDFDDIRPVFDVEVKHVIGRLLDDEAFANAVKPIIAPMTWDMFVGAIQSCDTVYEFQRNIVYPFVKQIIERTTDELSAVGVENFDKNNGNLFISNHRDIVLDAAFLNILFFDNDMDTSEIAIGDNLLVYPWITDLVRLNKSFIVKRKVSVREMLATSKQLSEYIYDTIKRRNQSIWLAQREGRAKDSNDRTQTSLLKMLTLYDRSKPFEALKSLNIVPLALSYEYDPCDYLKAKEFQQKRDNPNHVKSKADDIENMITGISGHKGRVVFSFGNPLNNNSSDFSDITNNSELLSSIGNYIDKEIFMNYHFYPINYIAYDMMMGSAEHSDKYTSSDVDSFNKYIEEQISKVELPNKDVEFLRGKIIEMYGNTLKNHLSIK